MALFPDIGTQLTWQKERAPMLPFFDDDKLVAQTCRTIREELCSLLLDAADRALYYRGVSFPHPPLASEDNARSWLAALLTQKYGAIYPITRPEAKALLPTVIEDGPLVAEIAKLLNANNCSNPIYNSAIRSFLERRSNILRFASFDLPPFAIYVVSPERLYVNQDDYETTSIDGMLTDTAPHYDLHDYAHLACATLSADLYGAKYFDSFLQLPDYYQNLLRDSAFATESAIPYSDNLAFRELSLSIFNSIQHEQLSEDDITTFISHSLCSYFSGEQALLQPSTGMMLKVPRPLGIDELAEAWS